MQGDQKKSHLVKIIGIVGLIGLCMVIYYTFVPDSLDKFRGIRWGSDIQGLSRMDLVAEEGELKFYSRQDDTMKVQNIDIDNIITPIKEEPGKE